jgi:hypothetical protein
MSSPENAALFQPEMFVRIARSYDLAIASLKDRRISADEKERTALAARIIDVALTGERDPKRISAKALAHLWPDRGA